MIYLSKSQLKLLKRIAQCSKIDITDLSTADIACAEYLEELGYVHITRLAMGVNGIGMQRPPEVKSISITECGKAYLTHLKTDRFRFLFPTIVSIFAAIGAYREELSSLVQALMKLLK